MIIHNKVYNLKTLMGNHPGGDDILLSRAGTDGTKDFEAAGLEWLKWEHDAIDVALYRRYSPPIHMHMNCICIYNHLYMYAHIGSLYTVCSCSSTILYLANMS